MKPDKENLPLPFIFIKRKMLMHTELFVKRMVTML